jgi:acetyl-CoA acetyltransferase
MHDNGVTEADLAMVVEKSHRHAVNNPVAMYRKPISVEQVVESRMVVDPLRLLMLCAPNEGAAAVVLESARTSQGGRRPRRTLLRAVAFATRSGPGDDVPRQCAWNVDEPGATELAAAQAFERAGIGPSEVDVAEVQDTDAASELIHIEKLGLCVRGEAVALLRAGELDAGGSRPVNPSGGLLSNGEALGASALRQVVELAMQLEGRAAGRQVTSPRVGLSHVYGAPGVSCVTLVST